MPDDCGPLRSDLRAQERFALTFVIVSMAFVLSPVAPPPLLPFSMPLYWTMLALALGLGGIGLVAERPGVGVFEVAVAACGAWMIVASVRSGPRFLEDLLVWESGIVLALFAAARFGSAVNHRFLARLFLGIVLFQLVAASAQMAVYVHGQPTSGSEFFTSFLGDQPISSASGYVKDVSWRFTTGVPGLGHRVTVAPGTFWTVNVLGAWLAMLAPLLFAAAGDARDRARTACFYLFATAGVADLLLIVRNLTRGALVGAVAGLVVYGALRHLREGRGITLRRPSRRVVVSAAVGLALAAAATVGGLSASDDLRKAFRGRMVGLIAEDGTLRARLALHGMLSVWAHPVFGIGHGNYRSAMPLASAVAHGISDRKERSFSDKRLRLSSHNAFVMLAQDSGLPGALTFLAALAAVAVRARRRWKEWTPFEAALAAGVAGGLVMCLFYGCMYREVWPLLLFLIGCLSGACRLHLDRNRTGRARTQSPEAP